jgi:hypothetical protein
LGFPRRPALHPKHSFADNRVRINMDRQKLNQKKGKEIRFFVVPSYCGVSAELIKYLIGWGSKNED